YFFFVAEEVRRLMAQLGFRTVAEMTGRADRLDTRRALHHWKAAGLDLSRILHMPTPAPDVAVRHCETQDHGLERALDNTLIAQAGPALERGEPVRIETTVKNVNRSVGAMLSGRVAERYGHTG